MTVEGVDEAKVGLLSEAWHRLIRYYNRHYTVVLEKKLGGITSLELDILDHVACKPNVMIKEIRKNLRVSGSTLTAAVDRLHERGYLERIISPSDRRSFNLQITLGGKKAHDQYMTTEREFLRKLLHALRTSEERQGLVSTLHKAALNIA
jgi:DNA-binding MarR family transcriptional regulator